MQKICYVVDAMRGVLRLARGFDVTTTTEGYPTLFLYRSRYKHPMVLIQTPEVVEVYLEGPDKFLEVPAATLEQFAFLADPSGIICEAISNGNL